MNKYLFPTNRTPRIVQRNDSIQVYIDVLMNLSGTYRHIGEGLLKEARGSMIQKLKLQWMMTQKHCTDFFHPF